MSLKYKINGLKTRASKLPNPSKDDEILKEMAKGITFFKENDDGTYTIANEGKGYGKKMSKEEFEKTHSKIPGSQIWQENV